jgi:hypothetical protein
MKANELSYNKIENVVSFHNVFEQRGHRKVSFLYPNNSMQGSPDYTLQNLHAAIWVIPDQDWLSYVVIERSQAAKAGEQATPIRKP